MNIRRQSVARAIVIALLFCASSCQSAIGADVSTIKIEKFTTGSGATWTKESWAQKIEVILIGGGGPGGGGARRLNANAASGGAGGGGGSIVRLMFAASQLGATETYTVAGSQAGGAAAGANDTNGSQGSVGFNTLF